MAPGCTQRALGFTVIVTCLLPATPRSGAPATALAETEGVVVEAGVRAAGPAQRRRELYNLRRQDGADALAREGVEVKWRQHSLAEIRDWQDRLAAARALRAELGVDMDWRITSLAELTEIRLRAAKAVEMAHDFGVLVDWPRYSWSDLEALRQHLAQLNSDRTSSRTSRQTAYKASDTDGLATPGTSMPNRRPASNEVPRYPDAIVEPTFTSSTPGTGMRQRVPSGRPADPDAILIPTFVTMATPRVKPNPFCGVDDLMDPWNPHFPGLRNRR